MYIRTAANIISELPCHWLLIGRRGWPLAFFACLINECQLGFLACEAAAARRRLSKKGPYKEGENDSPQSHICRLAVNTYVTVVAAKTLLFWLLPVVLQAGSSEYVARLIATVAGGPYKMTLEVSYTFPMMWTMVRLFPKFHGNGCDTRTFL